MALDLDPNYQYYHNKGLAYQVNLNNLRIKMTIKMP